ncbi:MAG: endonuclease III [Vicinamibacteria bacterium]
MRGREEQVSNVLRILSRETGRGRYAVAPVYQGIEGERTPYRTLVACLISTRTRDEQTIRISRALFAIAPTPQALLRLSEPRLRRILYGAGFYRQKAKQLRSIARALVNQGGVPRTLEALLELPGIGPKCANLVLASCFGAPRIAVDTHVHRISNRLGWVRTKTPEKTETALTPLVPVRWRRRVNVMLVAHGQLICKPIGPRCEKCGIYDLCQRRGVVRKSKK